MAISKEKVNEGLTIVSDVSNSFNEIIDSVRHLNHKSQQVSNAASEVLQAVYTVASTTEEQTAAMQEVTSSVDMLDSTAQELKGFVTKFNI
jgi:methyl-accepting chemotaxis protein